MNEDIARYARVGLSHHMLHPKCMVDGDDHVATFEEFLKRTDIETFDCCAPYGRARRKGLLPQIRDCGKEVVYAAHFYPFSKMALGSTNPQEQEISKLFFKDQIEVAVAVGATGFVFASGANVSDCDRPAACAAFTDFCRWFCRELKPHGIDALLEPFDRDFAKKFLYGSSEQCVDLIRSLEPEIDNFGIELDFAHVPLMHETFEHAVNICKPYLRRVHLGNCVMKDPDHPFYGDQHPPMGIDSGEIDVPELAEILKLLLDAGFLNRQNRRGLILEMQPFPGMTADETVADQMERLHKAWKMVRPSARS